MFPPRCLLDCNIRLDLCMPTSYCFPKGRAARKSAHRTGNATFRTARDTLAKNRTGARPLTLQLFGDTGGKTLQIKDLYVLHSADDATATPKHEGLS